MDAVEGAEKMYSEVLNVGLVGYGFAGRTFHAPVIAGVPGLRLAVVASSQPDAVHRDWPQARVVAQPAALLASADVDMVVIATPNDSHHTLARAALEAGKHVVVDKPFTMNLVEAQELLALSKARQRVLSVFHNRRFDADFLTLQDVLASGHLGRLVYFESHFDRYRPQVLVRWRDQPGAGGIWPDLGSHLVDQAVQLFGVPDAIHADMGPIRDHALTEDYFHVQLRYEQGAHTGLRVVLHATTIAAAPAPRYRVHGTLGSYVKHGVDPQEDALKAGARPCLDDLGGWGADPQPGHLSVPGESSGLQVVPSRPGNYMSYYAAVRDAVNGVGANPVTPEQASQVMALLELGRESSAQRREVRVLPH